VASHISDSAVSLPRSRRGILVLCAILLLAMFVVRPGASRLKARIANSIGNALQRRVEIGSVHLRLLPRPGFDLENFVVHDDPAFGAEPVLRAGEVSASLRLSSLFRGRIEISQLSMTEPSLNLTRNADGRWNVETLLERTSMTTVAPTAKGAGESRPAFPYIEADRGRINFKLGPEKKPFAFTEADYSFWQDSENAWGMRLKARPMRTDLNLTDSGQLQVNGTWKRAVSLRETPVQFSFQWDGAQLGQVTKLFSGQDRGWRGTISVTAELTGTPADLTVQSDGSLEDFRRYDILNGGLLTLHTHCEAHYSTVDRGLHQIFCQTPSGDGAIALLGEVRNVPGPREYDLKLAADKFPAQSLLALIRHAKRDLPDDLVATGTLAAEFNLRNEIASPLPEWTGNGQTSDLRLRSRSAKAELALGVVPFSVSSTPRLAKNPRNAHNATVIDPLSPLLIVGPVSLKLGRPSGATAQISITRLGYDTSLNGETDLQRTLQIARAMGIPAANPRAEGWAKVDLHLLGQWTGFAAPKATGMVQLHAVRADIRGLEGPLEISSANVSLSDNETRVDAISVSVAGSGWTGSLSFPRMCAALSVCPLAFNLHVDEISTETLNTAFNTRPVKKKWYGFLSADAQVGPSFLAQLKGAGKLTANRVSVGQVVALHAVSNVTLDSGKLDLIDLRGDLLGGQHRGEWHVDFTVSPPKYLLAGVLQTVSLDKLGDAMHDNWIAGIGGAHYKLEMAGRDRAELTQSAKGNVEFSMQEGSFPHIALTGGLLKVRSFNGRLTIADGQIEMQDASLQSPTTTYAVSGRASLARDINFKLLQEGASSVLVTGTVEDPQVEVSHRTETRAELKP
jgi:hypothetical protein